MTSREELRRTPRARVCCRVDVRQRYATWSAVTEELSVRGCRIVTTQLPSLGATLQMRLSSDLFPEELDVVGEVVWIAFGRIGVVFQEPPRTRKNGALSPTAWVRRVMEHGRNASSSSELLVPVVQSTGRSAPERRPRVVSIGRGERRRSS